MGDASIIRQGPSEARYTTDLDHSGKPRVQVCQRALQEFAVTGIPGSLELLEHMLAGQQQALALALAGDLGGSQRRLRWTRRRHCFRLLLLDRLTFPTSCHPEIIPSRTITLSWFVQTLDEPFFDEQRRKVAMWVSGKSGLTDTKSANLAQTCHPKKIKSLLVRKLGL
jgi:hypothetical protein